MSSSTSVRFPDALKAEATAYAEALGISLNALCAVALRDYLDQRKMRGGGGRDVSPPAAATAVTPAPVESRTATSRRGGEAPTFGKPAEGVNAPCPCGSGAKWKRCHGAKVAS
jgi:hypothetical protein